MKAFSLCSKIFALAVFALGAQAFAASPTVETAKLNCAGTEPFWSMYIGPEGISFFEPLMSDDATPAKTYYAPAAPQSAAGTGADFVRVYKTVKNNGSEPLTAVISQDANCTDGMSGNLYTYSAVVLKGEAVYAGCCNVRGNTDQK